MIFLVIAIIGIIIVPVLIEVLGAICTIIRPGNKKEKLLATAILIVTASYIAVAIITA